MVNFSADQLSMLSQMRQLAVQADQSSLSRHVESTKGDSFGTYLNDAINSVDGKQKETSSLENKYVDMDPSVSLGQVMVQMQKSRIALSAMVAVRNKVVDAYKAVMNMEV